VPISAFFVSDWIDCCNVGLLWSSLLKRSKLYEGILAKFVDDHAICSKSIAYRKEACRWKRKCMAIKWL